MDYILLVDCLNRQLRKASFRILDAIQVAQAVLVLIFYFLFVKKKYFFTVLPEVCNGVFEYLFSV